MRWRRELRGTFSANAATIPQWELDLAEGDDGGYFGPKSAAWAVHGSMTTLVAGIQALLIQSLHPGAMAGVHDHSDYKNDPLSRLAGTIRWIFTLTYGDTVAAAAASNKILRIHTHVTGSYENNSGELIPYTANDPDLLRWVQLAFTEAFLSSHKKFGGNSKAHVEPDAYVADWAVAAHLMNVPNPPLSEAQLHEQLAQFTPALRYDQRVADTVAFLRNPPLPRSQQLGYQILFAAAVSSMAPEYREMLGLKVPRWGIVPQPVNLCTRLVLRGVQAGLGKTGPSEASARARRRRLGLEN